MNPDPRRLEVLFEAALALPAAARPAFLTQACTGDDALRQQLEGMLQAHEHATGPLDASPAAAVRTALLPPRPEENPGDVIGRYKLLQKIGEGGCGVVYMAEQQEPVVRRVALKVIKLGMDTKEVIARFEAERQALALMDHPNIAKVLDAGATAAGRPYFVMELVRGIPLTKFCDENNLSTEERLKLFTAVCHAIQHAHQKGIIHRDIKPSNILVTLHDGVPVPKVIDFGIAKATAGRLTDNTVFTAFEQFIGTPAYMSPEQAELSGLDIDTRSDVYSLGVLLYELLTGRTPFDTAELLKVGIDAMRRHIREVDPPKPSTRLSTLQGEALSTTAKQRQITAPRLVNLLRGDLDWIVMKALEKNRTRRYETANSLADDIQRHLQNEPVVASPPSAAYRLSKMVRRNKLVFTAAAGIALALVGGMISTSWQAVRARQAEHATALRAYAANINLAQQAITNQNYVRAAKVLEGLRPAPGQPDLRGWEWRFLWQQCRSDEIQIVQRRRGVYGIYSVALSFDGGWIAYSQPTGSVYVVNTTTNKVAGRLWVGNWSVKVFSPNESLLAAGGSIGDGKGGFKGVIKLWDTRGNRVVREIELEGICRHLSFSRDGRALVVVHRRVAPKDEVAADLFAVYDVATGQPTGQPAPLAIGDGALRASSDYPGTRTPFAVSLAAGFAAHTSPRGFCVIDLATGQRRWSHEADSFGGRAAALALSVDSQVLAVANPTGAITLWEAGTGRQIGQFPEKSSPVRTLAFTPDGTTLASGHIDRLIRIWDAKRCVLTGTLNGHAYPITNLAVGTDGRTLVSGGRGDEEVLLWDLRRAVHAPVRFSIPAPRWLGWAFSTDGRSVLTSYVENNRWIFNRWSGRDFREREMLAEVPLASRSAIQNQYATWSESPFAIGYTRMVGHPGSFTNLLLGTFFNKLLKTEVGDVINNVVRDRKTKRTITVMDPGFREWGAVSFDGTRLVVYSSGTEPLRIYDTGSSRELISLGSELYLDGSTKAAFSPDGNCVGMQIGSVVHIWTAPSWAEIEAAEKSAR